MGRPMGLMIKGGVVFCAIIGKTVGTRSPKITELTLIFTSEEPVVLHVHGFGFLVYDIRLPLDGNPKGCEVVEHIATKVEVNPQMLSTLKNAESI